MVKSSLASARSLESSWQYSRVKQKPRDSVQRVTSQLLSSLMKTAPQRTGDFCQKQLLCAFLFLLLSRKNISLFRLKKHSHVIRRVVACSAKEVGSLMMSRVSVGYTCVYMYVSIRTPILIFFFLISSFACNCKYMYTIVSRPEFIKCFCFF